MQDNDFEKKGFLWHINTHTCIHREWVVSTFDVCILHFVDAKNDKTQTLPIVI